DATGCDIGVYYDAADGGGVKGGTISGATRYGVFVDGIAGDVNVDVTRSTIDNIGDQPRTGGQHGVGIYYDGIGTPGSVTGTVGDSTVSNYQKGGIVVNGENADVMVTGNEVTGVGAVSYIAQNGIQFGYGGSGQARGNTVDGNWYTGANWTSTGILVFESDNVIVDRNTVSNSQTGLDAESWCYFGVPSASNNKFDGNTVTGADYGITVAAYSVYSACDPAADNNKVVGNALSGTGDTGSEGIFVGSFVYTPGYTPKAENNKVIHNSISGFETPIDTGLATGTKVHANATP
ncbi:MAG TPA: right-handed parallel beta-helix repeat-containing protein, partial [Gaiellaceae bacterium]|nr:right-handed parallel beta-helix repeat-containing protein [Gaiellaceae bacterium]